MVLVPNNIAKIIARFMEDKAGPEEIGQLTEWMNASDDNMQFFETILEERNTNWAKKWFRDAGVKNNYFKGKSFNGWYTPEPTSLRSFYILMILALLALVYFFFVIRYVAKDSGQQEPFPAGRDSVNINDTMKSADGF